MTERNDASRLNNDWDELVQTPRAARQPSENDDTIGKLHALDSSASPDPAFRSQLLQQLLRENAYRTGQDRSRSVPDAAPAGGMSGPTSRFSRAMELIAVAVIVVLVGTALIVAIEFRGDREDEDISPTFELAATSTNPVVASPENTVAPTTTPLLSPTVSPPSSETSTIEPTTTPVATQAPSATADPEPTDSAVIVAPPTEVPGECADVLELLTTVTSTLAATELPSGLVGSFPATSGQIDAVNTEFETFVSCLNAVPPNELRTLVIETYATPDTSLLDRAQLAQELSALAAQPFTISDVAILPGSQVSATVTLEDGTVYIGIFSLQNAGSSATILHIYPDIPESSNDLVIEPTSAPTVPTTTANPSAPSDDNSGSDNSGSDDDDDNSDSGSDDEDGDESESDEDEEG